MFVRTYILPTLFKRFSHPHLSSHSQIVSTFIMVDFILHHNTSAPSTQEAFYHHINGDLSQDFDTHPTLIVQLNNCVARKVHKYSLTWELSRRYPYADPYQQRLSGPYPNLASEVFRPKPGSIEILHPPQDHDGPSFACLFGQYKMGRCDSTYYLNCPKIGRKYSHMSLKMDTYEHRLHYFHQCLHKLFNYLCNTNKFDYVAFPFKIGCGLAGGNWNDYEPMIRNFSARLRKQKPKIKVIIVTKYTR